MRDEGLARRLRRALVVRFGDDAIADHFADTSDTLCYATKENQDAARELCADPEIDLILVIGGKQSANTRHLWEICREHKPSYLIQGPADLEPAWLEDVSTVGITAGASTPDYVIDEVEQAIVEAIPIESGN